MLMSWLLTKRKIKRRVKKNNTTRVFCCCLYFCTMRTPKCLSEMKWLHDIFFMIRLNIILISMNSSFYLFHFVFVRWFFNFHGKKSKCRFLFNQVCGRIHGTSSMHKINKNLFSSLHIFTLHHHFNFMQIHVALIF